MRGAGGGAARGRAPRDARGTEGPQDHCLPPHGPRAGAARGARTPACLSALQIAISNRDFKALF
jgi:hypothetical protein